MLPFPENPPCPPLPKGGIASKKIMLVAGEASGEQHGAELVRALKKYPAEFYFYGVGGRQMREAGVDILVDCAELAVMGFGDVIKHLPQILRVFKQLKQTLINNRPDLLILIDYPGFNLRLAALAKKLGIKVLFYISPQVWAWRQGRVKKIAKVVDHMAVIFPFEVDFYQGHHVPVTYVGHPLTHVVKPTCSVETAKQKFALSSHAPVIGLLPGSRQREIQRLLPPMLQAAEKIKTQLPNAEFVLPLASTITQDDLTPFLAQTTLKIKLIENQTYDAMNVCDALIVSSGTATLETALLLKPMVIVYKVPRLTASLLKHFIKIENIGLCNVVAGKRIVPEFLQNDVNAEKLSQAILEMLENGVHRDSIINELKIVRDKLGTLDGSENVAKLAYTMLSI